MNIVILSEFAESELALIQAAVPDAVLHYLPRVAFTEIPADILANAEVIYTPGPLPSPEMVPMLQWVQANSAGVDHIVNHPLFKVAPASDRNHIQLTTASGIHAINMSEFILMMMLALAHRLTAAYHMKQQGQWNPQRRQFLPQELFGATVGFIGYGAVARQTARLCESLGMHVLTIRHGEDEKQIGVAYYRQDEKHAFLQECDFVVVAAPLTRDTFHFIDAAALNAMKRTAYLVSVSRGDVVDEQALINALQSGRIAGAAMDVFSREPLPDTSPLWQLENVIMTPHVAGNTPNYERRAAELFARNLKRFSAGQPLVNKVDFTRGY